jgi:hypothetical protein
VLKLKVRTTMPSHIFLDIQSVWGWRYGSSGKVPALQVQDPDFKPQNHQNKNFIKTQEF